MAKRGSIIDRIQPHRSRSKMIAPPFHVEVEGEKFKVKVLGQDALEAAYLAARDHFAKIKPPLNPIDTAFVHREHVEIVFRAYEDSEGNPLADDVDELAKHPEEIIAPLYAEWSRFQDEVAIRPMKQSELDELVDGLKKNTLAEVLPALPSSWLIALATTLASQLANSTPANSAG